jgi:DNA-binding IclR family transcriptional regulator
MEVIYLEKLGGLHAIGIMSSRVGGRAPSHCTGLGKLLLAYEKPDSVAAYFKEHGLRRYTDTTITDLDALLCELEAVRGQGFAFDHGEHENEVRCVAAPVFNASGSAVAAISVSGPYARLDPLEGNQGMIEKVIRTANQISHQLGYTASKQIET